MRVRLIYEKRGGACFVPHVALATLFARAARRAGVRWESTGGFSPHAKMSFGPELPAGVVALGEPVDLWVGDGEKGERSVRSADWLPALNAQMPEGFRVLRRSVLYEGAPALGKDCRAALYWIWDSDENKNKENSPLVLQLLVLQLKKHFGEDILSIEIKRT